MTLFNEAMPTKSLHTTNLWQSIEEAIMQAQEGWFDGQRLKKFKSSRYMQVTSEEIQKFKLEIEETVRLTLRTQLWEKFDENEYKAFLDAFMDMVFIPSQYFHFHFISIFNPEVMSYDGISLLMRNWLIAHGVELNEMNIQQRNQKIAEKIRQINKYLIGTPMSEKLESAITISFQATYSKAVIDEAREKFQEMDAMDGQNTVWLITKREKFTHTLDQLHQTLVHGQNLFSLDVENIASNSIVSGLERLLEDNKGVVNLGEFRSLCQDVGFFRGGHLVSLPTMQPFDDIFHVPMGMLGIMYEHLSHTFFLEDIQQDQSKGYRIHAFEVKEFADDEDAIQHYIDLYISAIPQMYNELTTYNDEYMSEITLSHLNAMSFCYRGNLSKYDLPEMVKAALGKRAEAQAA